MSANTGASPSARALLRSLGGETVTVRFAAPPGGGDGEELGLASPEFRDVVLRPSLVRTRQDRTVVLVDAAAAAAALGTDEVETLLQAAISVTVQGKSFRIEAVERRSCFGRAYLYRLLLGKEGETP